MFCKWCGSNLVTTGTKCKRCGKQAPVLSDCGGFYDLVTGTNASIEVRQVASKSTKIETNSKKSRFLLIALAVVYILAILVFLLVIVLGKQ